jgi:hypothetical protein
MPIRINLREVFASDSQTIAVDKINFNFNKILELGVGEEGPLGDTGPQGPAGPVGPEGPVGQDGITWHVGSTDPNVTPPSPVQDGDFYLNTSDSTIWQWDEGGTVWNQLIDFTTIINAYLATTTQTFFRGFGDPSDTNFIVFPNRDEIGDGSTDILFLSNFNEITTPISNLSSPYTSLLDGGILQIYADSTAGGSDARANLEFGAIYSNGVDTLISERDQNLKIKYYQHDNEDSTFTSVASFNISKLEGSDITAIDRYGVLKFITPNYVDGGTNSELSFYLGSQGGTSYLTSESLNSSGLVITSSASYNWIEFGIADDLFWSDSTYAYRDADSDFLNISGNNKNYVYLKGGDNTSGVFIDSTLVQDSGDIIQAGTGSFVKNKVITPPINTGQSASDYSKHTGMAMYGDRIYVVHGDPTLTTSISSTASAYDKYHVLLATDPSNLKNWITQENLSLSSTSSSFLYGACDIDIAGDYAYIVSNHTSDRSGTKIPFAIAKIDEEYHGELTLLYSLSNSNYSNGAITSSNTQSDNNLGYAWTNLSAAYRLKVKGNIAYVINKYDDDSAFSGDGIEGDQAGAYLSAIDISNPYNPIIVNSVVSSGEKRSTDMAGTTYSYGGYRHLALDVNKSIAATLTWKRLTTGASSPDYSRDEFGDDVTSGTTNQIILNLYDLSDARTDADLIYSPDATEELPSVPNLRRFSATPIQTQSTGPLTDFGSVSIFRNYVFVSWENSVYVYQIPNNIKPNVESLIANPATSLLTYEMADSTYYAIDSKISGRFLYVLWRKTVGTTGVVTKHDIFKMIEVGGNSSLEPIASYQFALESSYGNGVSRLLINGKYVYVSSSHSDDQFGSEPLNIKTLSSDGIISPAAHIDSIQTSILKVNETINVGDSANIGHSLNVGSGGIATTGPVSARGINGNFHNFGVSAPLSNSFNPTISSHDKPLCGISSNLSILQSGLYQFTNISPTTEQRFFTFTHTAQGTPVPYSGGFQAIRLLWTRVGNVVNVSGFVYVESTPLPALYGFAFPAPLYPAEISSDGPYSLYAAGVGNAIGGGVQVSGTLSAYYDVDISTTIECINVVTGELEDLSVPYLALRFFNNDIDQELGNFYFSGSYLLTNLS